MKVDHFENGHLPKYFDQNRPSTQIFRPPLKSQFQQVWSHFNITKIPTHVHIVIFGNIILHTISTLM